MALVVTVSMVPVSALGVTVSIQNDWPVDIVLCAGDTNKDLDKFKEQLTAALVTAGVDESRLNITASEVKKFTSVGDGLKVLQNDWLLYPSGVSRPVMNGGELSGPSPRGLLVCNEKETTGNVKVNMDFTWWCAVHVGGLSPRMAKKSDGDYEGYWISLEAPDSISQEMYVRFGSKLCPVLYRVNSFGAKGAFPYRTNPIGNAFPDATMLSRGNYVDCRPDSNNRQAHQVVCELNGSILQCWIDGKLCMTYDLRGDPKGMLTSGTMGYGLSNSNHIGLSAVAFEYGAITPLIEAVRSPNYNSSSSRFIVDVCDTPREDFGNVEMVGELTQRMQADNAYYIGWGQNDSKVSIENFIKHNNGNGTYLRNTDSDIYQQTAKYIEPIVNKILTGKDTEYLLKDYSYGFTQTYN